MRSTTSTGAVWCLLRCFSVQYGCKQNLFELLWYKKNLRSQVNSQTGPHGTRNNVIAKLINITYLICDFHLHDTSNLYIKLPPHDRLANCMIIKCVIIKWPVSVHVHDWLLSLLSTLWSLTALSFTEEVKVLLYIFFGCFFFPQEGRDCHSRVTFWNCLESGQINKGAKSWQERHNMPFTEAWTCYLKKWWKSLSESDHFDRTCAPSGLVISLSFLDDRVWLPPLVI